MYTGIINVHFIETGGKSVEVSVKQARSNISSLLNRIQEGEEVLILRRGEKVARLVPVDKESRKLPDLSGFRSSIQVQGEPLSQTVIQEREQERF